MPRPSSLVAFHVVTGVLLAAGAPALPTDPSPLAVDQARPGVFLSDQTGSGTPLEPATMLEVTGLDGDDALGRVEVSDPWKNSAGHLADVSAGPSLTVFERMESRPSENDELISSFRLSDATWIGLMLGALVFGAAWALRRSTDAASP